MKAVNIFNHPNEGSFCAAILRAVISGLEKSYHEVDLIHLDRKGFNPVMTAKDLQGFVNSEPVDPKVLEYGKRIHQADHLIFIFPIWWELMPAMTKGFFDKVIFPGITYEYDRNGKFPKMIKKWKNLRRVTLITTMNTPSVFYRFVFGDAIKKALFSGTFWKLKYQNRNWISLNMVKFVSDSRRRMWLDEIENRIAKLY